MQRTAENLRTITPFYVDSLTWKFYEGDASQIVHGAKIEMVMSEGDKYPVILVTISTEERQVMLRLASYDFTELNNLFKRASFRLEK